MLIYLSNIVNYVFVIITKLTICKIVFSQFDDERITKSFEYFNIFVIKRD